MPNADSVANYSYAGSSSVESGEILMEAMAEVMGGKGNMLELQGFYGHEPQIERHLGIENVLKKFPDIKVLAEDSGKWNREEGMKKVENWIQSDLKGKFNAIVAHNDEMAVGAVKALEDAGLADKVLVGGIDATPDALNMLKEGKLAVTVFQDAFGQGAKGIELAVKALQGEKLEREYIIPYLRVKKEEADKYLALFAK
jgi:inositol transport system substrate-binding protein